MFLAFFSHKPEGVEKEKHQFSNLYTLFPPFSVTSVKVLLSYTNALGLSEKERTVWGKKNKVCKIMHESGSWEIFRAKLAKGMENVDFSVL